MILTIIVICKIYIHIDNIKLNKIKVKINKIKINLTLLLFGDIIRFSLISSYRGFINDNKSKKIINVLSVVFSMTGCASLFSTETQSVKIASNSSTSTDITCTVQNGRGSWNVPLGESVEIRRDSRPLAVICYDKNHNVVGSGSAPSQYNTTNLWNIPLTLIPAAGIAGWVLDGTNGTANEYPKSVNIYVSPKSESSSTAYLSSVQK